MTAIKYDLKKDCFYVQFAGTMGMNFDYKMVLRVAEKLKQEKKISDPSGEREGREAK